MCELENKKKQQPAWKRQVIPNSPAWMTESVARLEEARAEALETRKRQRAAARVTLSLPSNPGTTKREKRMFRDFMNKMNKRNWVPPDEEAECVVWGAKFVRDFSA